MEEKMTGQLTGKTACTLGVISDTHGRLPEAVAGVFHRVDLIVHAGDIDTPEVLEDLRRIAPVVAVRGNMDFGAWADNLQPAETITVDDLVIHIQHIPGYKPALAGVKVVINGHTHQPWIEKKEGVLFLNPGSAGQRRYGGPLSVALLSIEAGSAFAEIVDLEK